MFDDLADYSYSCNSLDSNESKRLYITQDHNKELARIDSVELLGTESALKPFQRSYREPRHPTW